MIYTIINCLLYIFLLWSYWRHKRGIDCYFVITLFYTITAICCSINYSLDSYNWPDLGLIPFLYLFVVLLILLKPVRNFGIEQRRTFFYDNKTLYYIGLLYIILGFSDIAVSLPDTIARYQSGEWLDIRNQLYNDAESVVYYENSFQKFIKNFTTYVRPFAIIYFFFQLTKPKINKIYVILLLASFLVPTFLGATVVASRGLVYNFSVQLFLAYLLFRSQIQPKVKKYLVMTVPVVAFVFISYSIAVSVSRFGEDEAGNSIFDYFGHSMLYFNDGMFNNLHDYAYGKRFFSWFIDVLGGDSHFDPAKAGGTWGTAFFTIVGGLYYDAGPIGCVIFAILICLFMNHFFKKPVLRLSDMMIILAFLNTLAAGIFVVGNGDAIGWAMLFILYSVIRKAELGNIPN